MKSPGPADNDADLDLEALLGDSSDLRSPESLDVKILAAARASSAGGDTADTPLADSSTTRSQQAERQSGARAFRTFFAAAAVIVLSFLIVPLLRHGPQIENGIENQIEPPRTSGNEPVPSMESDNITLARQRQQAIEEHELRSRYSSSPPSMISPENESSDITASTRSTAAVIAELDTTSAEVSGGSMESAVSAGTTSIGASAGKRAGAESPTKQSTIAGLSSTPAAKTTPLPAPLSAPSDQTDAAAGADSGAPDQPRRERGPDEPEGLAADTAAMHGPDLDPDANRRFRELLEQTESSGRSIEAIEASYADKPWRQHRPAWKLEIMRMLAFGQPEMAVEEIADYKQLYGETDDNGG